MVTRLYLHAATSSVTGTLPTTKQSTQTQNGSIDSISTSKRSMDTTIGTSQTALASASNAIGFGVNGNLFVAKFYSQSIGQTSIAANTWTINIAGNTTSIVDPHPNGSSSSGSFTASLFVWRPSAGTKTGTIKDAATATFTSPSGLTTETCSSTTFTGSAVSSIVAGDVLVLELFITANNSSNNFVYTNYFDGATATTTNNTTVTNHAAFIETPENLTLGVIPPVDATSTTISNLTNKFITKI